MNEDLMKIAENAEKYRVLPEAQWHIGEPLKIEYHMSDAVQITWIICGTVFVIALLIAFF